MIKIIKIQSYGPSINRVKFSFKLVENIELTVGQLHDLVIKPPYLLKLKDMLAHKIQ